LSPSSDLKSKLVKKTDPKPDKVEKKPWIKSISLGKGLEWLGSGLSLFLLSFLFLMLFFLVNVSIEAYLQAELIHLEMQIDKWLMFAVMFTVLISIVYVAMNADYAKEFIENVLMDKIEDGKDKDGKIVYRYRRIKTINVAMMVYFFYNVAMSQMRVFYHFEGEFWSIGCFLRIFTGVIIPVNISVMGFLINKRMKKERR
jgi:hypothetical protein